MSVGHLFRPHLSHCQSAPPPRRGRPPTPPAATSPVKMEQFAAVITTVGLLSIVLLALMYRFLPKLCRRKEMNLQAAQGGGKSGGGETNSATQVARASPQLCSYKKRRFLASFPSLDRLLCQSISWQEGVTLESGLANQSSRNEGSPPTQEGQSAHADAQIQESNNNHDEVNKNQNNRTEVDGGPGKIPQPCGTSAATQTNSDRVHNSTGILAHSILNMVSSIPSISLGTFSQSQSLPNVHGCLTESVSTPSGSRDLVVLWSTTLESNDTGILTSTRLE